MEVTKVVVTEMDEIKVKDSREADLKLDEVNVDLVNADQVKNLALKYFDGAGIAPAVRPDSFAIYERWIDQGLHGQMNYLKRHLDQKREPQRLLPGARSWISLSLNYDTQEPLSIDLQDVMKDQRKGWVARYARGGDYHVAIAQLHERLIAELEVILPGEKFLSCVDFKAVLERDVAARAGLGWVGKNTCLIDQKLGSFIFLSEILTTAKLMTDKPVFDHCGTCHRCIDACPTQALIAPRQLDATKCISYWTIETNQPPPSELAARFGVNLFGCDICQDVCPWNKKARRQNLLALPTASGMVDLQNIIDTDEDALKGETRFSALSRAKPEHLKRNAQNILRNLNSPDEKKFIKNDEKR